MKSDLFFLMSDLDNTTKKELESINPALTLYGRKVPAPTCNVTKEKLIPRHLSVLKVLRSK